MQTKERVVYLDLLRIVSILAVVCVHTTCQIFNSAVFEMPPIGSFNWDVAAILNSFSRYCVPVFIMISGSLFIGREVTIKKLYTKYVFRLILIFLIWSFFYSFVYYKAATLYDVVNHTLYGAPRFGFLLYIVGLYMISPVLTAIVRNKQMTKYYLSLCFIFCFLVPQLIALFKDSQVSQISFLVNVLSYNIERMNLQFFMGMTGFYLIGYVLANEELSPKWRKVIYLMGFAGAVVTAFMTIHISKKTGTAVYDWLGYLWVNVLFESVAVFVFFKYEVSRIHFGDRTKKLIGVVARSTLGVYLLHTAVLDVFLPNVAGINANSFNALLSVPVIVIGVFCVCSVISILLIRIPIIGKKII